ncbi:hypothetical protein [Amycolatopsis japonica]
MTDPATEPTLDPEFPTEGPDDDTRPPVVLVPSPTRGPTPPIQTLPPEPILTELVVATEQTGEGATP